MVVRARPTTATTAYARAVVAGDVVVSQLVKLAAERHLRDLDLGHTRGIWFDDAEARRVVAFCHGLRHSKGEWAGQSFDLEPWQAFIVGCLFGWKRDDGTRRFRTGYVSVARKNGKTTLAAAVGLYLAFADDEPGAEVYAAATKRDQAKICWSEAHRMVKATPALNRIVRSFVNNLHNERTASKFEPLGADADSMDGLNIHGAIVDELHAHKTRNMVDVIETATGARRQPLIVYITTAGYDRNSVCWEFNEYAHRVLSGVFDDDSYFAFVAGLDDGDDWMDPAVWPKANPNLGVSVKPEKLTEECRKAKEVPGRQNAFRRLHLNEWTEQSNRWLDMTTWDASAGDTDPDDLAGRECYAGLDLSTTQDITAFVAVFPDDDGAYDVLCRFWVPEDSIRERTRRDRVPYDVWAQQGWITPTEGNVVDYDVVQADIQTFHDQHIVREIPYDRYNAHSVVTRLGQEGATMVPFGQGYVSMSAPMREIERLVLSGKLRHGNNPVLRWMASNVAVSMDPAGNMKPDKAKSTERIDGIVALVMAIGRAMLHEPEASEPSILTIDWSTP